jgi:hypothetical protein
LTSFDVIKMEPDDVMTPTTYIEEHQREALEGYQMTEITPPDSPVRAFRLDAPEDEPQMSVLITFTPEGLILQGSMGPSGSEGNGVLATRGCDLVWFCQNHTAEELLKHFFARKVYQPEAAMRDLKLLSSGMPTDPEGLRGMAEDMGLLTDQGMLMKRLRTLGFSIDLASEVGMDYPLDDAGWICAIHRKFVELRQQVS